MWKLRLCSSCNRKLKWWEKLKKLKIIEFLLQMIEKVLFLNFLIVSYWLNYELTKEKMLIYIFAYFRSWNLIIIRYFKIVIVFKSYHAKDKDIKFTIFTVQEMFNLAAGIYVNNVTLDIAYLINKFQERLQGKHLFLFIFAPLSVGELIKTRRITMS